MRARAVYAIGWAIILSQIINLISMNWVYPSWTLDHTIAVFVIVSVLAAIHLLKFTKKFIIFAAFFSSLVLAGISASAIPDATGINSALLPLIVSGVILNGFICGWRTALVYSVFACILTWILFNISQKTPPPIGMDVFDWNNRQFQRAFQTSLALVIVNLIVSIFSINMNRLFVLLEETIKQTQHSETVKSQFLANMSHELRTPLNGVIGMNHLLLRTELDPKQRKYADIVNSCGRGLVAIINDVLDLSKLDAGKMEDNSEPFNLHEMIGTLLDLHRPQAIEKELSLHFIYDEHLPKDFVGNNMRLRQVINNLLGNAFKFTETGSIAVFVKGGPIQSANEPLYNIDIYVRDTGIGIAHSNIDRIFERFEQIDTCMNKKVQGTGLGLAISREIVEFLGGELNLVSELGEGTTFYFNIPLKTDPDLMGASSQTAPVETANQPRQATA